MGGEEKKSTQEPEKGAEEEKEAKVDPDKGRNKEATKEDASRQRKRPREADSEISSSPRGTQGLSLRLQEVAVNKVHKRFKGDPEPDVETEIETKNEKEETVCEKENDAARI